ncbi:MAG: hypothetical protein K0S45_4409, partial [Nitrospira sp.]|nr:hypothetical protein [Nitrospira sp.]
IRNFACVMDIVSLRDNLFACYPRELPSFTVDVATR